MELQFNKESILEQLADYKAEECKNRIYEDEDALTHEEQFEEIQSLKTYVTEIDESDILELASIVMPTKKNGKLRKGGISTLVNVNIADYVTDFTNCWYHDRLVLRALDENTIELVLENTQTTY